MISYIKGQVEHIFENYILLENNGMGYQIFVSQNSIAGLKLYEEIKIYTYMNVKEDSITLFGFLTMAELEVFNLLITVSGVGPKVAQAILNILSPESINMAIISEDIMTLSKAPGVGKKTAQRIILDLKDKVKTENLIERTAISTEQNSSLSNSDKQDALEALISLGYSRSEAVKAVLEVWKEEMDTQQILKLALKKLSSR